MDDRSGSLSSGDSESWEVHTNRRNRPGPGSGRDWRGPREADGDGTWEAGGARPAYMRHGGPRSVGDRALDGERRALETTGFRSGSDQDLVSLRGGGSQRGGYSGPSSISEGSASPRDGASGGFDEAGRRTPPLGQGAQSQRMPGRGGTHGTGGHGALSPGDAARVYEIKEEDFPPLSSG